MQMQMLTTQTELNTFINESMFLGCEALRGGCSLCEKENS